MDKKIWHAMSVDDACDLQHTDRARGLSSSDAAYRLKMYGRNELAEAPRPGVWHMLVQQFSNFIVLLLIEDVAI